MKIFEELKRRGLIAQMTHEDKIEELLNNNTGVYFYIGFDATADSLHIGHFLQIMVMSHMQRAGHKPIALLGTGTTMIGDPTGKTDMRKIMTPEVINYNAECFRRQMSKFIDFSEGKVELVRNGDWLLKMNYIDFLRDVGVHFSVNRMLTAECFKSRLEKGLSFLEFNYMLMQSYDYLHLNEKFGCKLELGGDDQWANILSGVDLVRRVKGEEVYGMTFTLLTTKDGKKMGKTENGALWLDADKCSPYDFYQYFRNVNDDDVINCLKLITFVPIEEIEEMERTLKGSELNRAKELLAFEVTKMVHSEEEAIKAQDAARTLFASDSVGFGTDENMPKTEISCGDFTDGEIGVIDLLIKSCLAQSRGEARRLIEQGGIYISDEKVAEPIAKIKESQFIHNEIVIRKGKKVYHKILKV